MGGQQRLCEDVVEREDAEERDHDGLVDGGADALGARTRSSLEQTIAMIALNSVVFRTDPQRSVTEALLKSVAKKLAERLTVGELGEEPTADPEQQRRC
ncbi:MAG: hypothetical protein R2691_07200 [Solirubrobacterales bacterium]